jgi:alpha-tubulin suppressor-like RCC1 family protein
VPEVAAGLSSGIVAVATGQGHACVLTTSGGVKCWGSGPKGQLGDGAPIRDDDDEHSPVHDSAVAVDVHGLSSNVVAISAGADHTCALTAKGGVLCWGQGNLGQLGNGARHASSIPVAVQGLSAGVRSISAGDAHTCAVSTVGSVKCWGTNADGELGDGTKNDRSVPVRVVGLSSGVIAVAVGENHACALTSPGTVKCWGNNFLGQLGDGTAEASPIPMDVRGL